MIEENEFERWVEASHAMFEIFEGHYDAYPLSVKWVQEWFDSKNFMVQEEHVNRISALMKNFDYEVYGVKGGLREKIDGQFKDLLNDHLHKGKHENIGFAVSPYLFTWNFWRFKNYFKKREDFSLEEYFRRLSMFLESERGELEDFRNKRLIYQQIERGRVERIFHEVNNELREIGISNNEPVGTIKLLHVFAPSYFPLIDNNIAKAIGLIRFKRESLTSTSYLKWMNTLKSWLQSYLELIEKLESGFHSSILKLVDEGLYIMCSVKLRLRVKELGLKVN